MGVQKDAGELLAYLYNELIVNNKSSIGTSEILNTTKWEGNRINHAYDYLNDLGLIKSSGGIGNNQGAKLFFIRGLYPLGINTLEDKKEFKKCFNFEVNLGLLKFSWGASEK